MWRFDRDGYRAIALSIVGGILAACGFTLGSVLGAGSESVAVGEDACSSSTDGGVERTVHALAAGASSFSVREEITERAGYYSSQCSIEVNGESLLEVNATYTDSKDFNEWSSSIDKGLISANGREKIRIGGGGYATPRSVGVYVPCTVLDDNKVGESRGGISIHVVAHMDGEYRAELTTIAEAAVDEFDSASSPCKEAHPNPEFDVS